MTPAVSVLLAVGVAASLPGGFTEPRVQVSNQENAAIKELGTLQTGEFRAEDGLRVLVVETSGAPVAAAAVSLFAAYQEEARERRPWKKPDVEEQAGRSARERDETQKCSDWREATAVELTDERGQAVFQLDRPGLFCFKAELIGFVPVRVGPFEIDSFELPRKSVMTPIRIVLPASIQSGGSSLPGSAHPVLLTSGEFGSIGSVTIEPRVSLSVCDGNVGVLEDHR